MRCEICTPAGRKVYLQILYKYLKAQRNEFDCWSLWMNTNNEDDIAFMKTLASENDWIKLVECPQKPHGIDTIGLFFQFAKKEDTIYIRLDDDIVFMELNFVKKLKEIRLKYPDPFLIYPNIINNSIISYLHYRYKLFEYEKSPGYACMDDIGWKDPLFSEAIHRAFLASVKSLSIDKWKKSFSIWKCADFERVSINCMSWFGSKMIPFNITIEEEQVLSAIIPKHINSPTYITNSPICVHYAFFTQRPHLDTTDILQQYRDIANSILPQLLLNVNNSNA
jgi:hypothetical protein